MEAASVPAAPAAADANGQVQAPAAPAPAPPTPDPAAPASPESDVLSQMDAMRQEIEALKGGQAPAAPESDPDLLTALQGEVDTPGFTPEELAALNAGQDPAQMGPEQQETQLAELTEFVRELAKEEAQGMVNPILHERQEEQVSAWAKDHPDVRSDKALFDEIVGTMDNMKAKFGDEAAMYVPLLNMVYTTAKAQRADAAATPAEQAGADGASLETGAGQAQVGEDSEADEYRKALKSTATSNPFG